MAVLSGLRGLLTRDENAVYYVSEALEQAGQAEVAVQWPTAALNTALERRSAVAADDIIAGDDGTDSVPVWPRDQAGAVAVWHSRRATSVAHGLGEFLGRDDLAARV